MNIPDLQEGDRIEAIFQLGDLGIVKNATVVFKSTDNRLLLAFDSPIANSYGSIVSHYALWEADSRKIKADQYSIAYGPVCWWWDHHMTLVKILASSPVEDPCLTCKRKNFRNETKCWWCGYHPFK